MKKIASDTRAYFNCIYVENNLTLSDREVIDTVTSQISSTIPDVDTSYLFHRRELQIIDVLLEAAITASRNFGVTVTTRPASHLVLTNEMKIGSQQRNGSYIPGNIFLRRRQKHLAFAATAAHELSHFVSFHARHQSSDKYTRVGMCLYSKKMFTGLNEGVTDIFAKYLLTHIPPDSFLHEMSTSLICGYELHAALIVQFIEDLALHFGIETTLLTHILLKDFLTGSINFLRLLHAWQPGILIPLSQLDTTVYSIGYFCRTINYPLRCMHD